MHFLLWLFVAIFSLPAVHANIESRAPNEQPAECVFDRWMFPYMYVQFINITGTACIGWDPSVICPRQDRDLEDLQEVARQQAKKHGIFENTRVGRWTAGFQFLTGRFENKDTSAFTWGAAHFMGQSLPHQWYFSRDGDRMVITTHCI